ncbi:hypothetical protein GH714_012337 [Hevea brasiliensis]|uniref:DUF4378 domain-containing protein n=1 Tax=Hevea brasiliensis TaxID=3981 RepID=A0A6A6LIK4_HEVBR|nr:hypothetical protein GH714_012337 [Hevea brasiliensis]
MNTIPYGVPSGCKLSTDEKDAPARLKEVTTHLDGDPTAVIEEEVATVGELHEDRVEQEKQSPASVLEDHFQDEIAGQTEYLVSKDDTDFNYVRDVLEVSGFIEQGCLGTWHSLDQPLSPTLFKELEAYLNHELECSSEDVGSNCDHQLLFDLINEFGKELAGIGAALKTTQSLDDIVAQDMAKDDGWMNLQLDVEDIALDLEDLIFDELLDEVMR